MASADYNIHIVNYFNPTIVQFKQENENEKEPDKKDFNPTIVQFKLLSKSKPLMKK